MCDGNYSKDPAFVASNRERFVTKKASYLLRDRYRRISGKRCAYCGFEAETGDHVPSLFAGYTNGVVHGVIVSVCTDCNRAIGPFSSTCFNERLEVISLVFDQLADRNQMWANQPNSGPQWEEKANKFKEKALQCKSRKNEENCYMLDWA